MDFSVNKAAKDFMRIEVQKQLDGIVKMLRDRLVAGIQDTALSDKIQLDSKLTLETAKKMIRQKEAVREQRVELTSCKEHQGEDVTRWPTGSQQSS